MMMMDRTEARQVLKLCVQNMNWYVVKRLAEAVATLGESAGAELALLAEWKHGLAVERGDGRK